MVIRALAAVAAAPVVTLFALAPALPASAAPTPADVSLTPGPTSTVVSVSPDVFYDVPTATYYLFTTGFGIGIYSSADGTSWAAVPGATSPGGPIADPSVIAMPDGNYRMYYAYRSDTTNPCSGKQLRYATSTDLIHWTAQPQTLLDDIGCGVPNVVRAAADDYRLYYVRGGSGLEHGTYMATSPDGLAWTPRAGILSPNDMVDPSVVQLPDGSWLMLTADFPSGKSSGPFYQKLYAATSANGFTWDFGTSTPLYVAPTPQAAFDPDAVVLPDGSVRAWWSQGSSVDNAAVAEGAVTIGTATPTITITGSRTSVGGKPGILINGVTTGLPDGSTVVPWYHFPGQRTYTAGAARPTIADGAFTWQRKTGKKFYAYVTTSDGLKSNTVTIQAPN